MSADLPTLRAKVEAARALAAKATEGHWAADVVHGDLGDRVSILRSPSGAPDDAGDLLAEVWTGNGADGQLMAAAPDLVTLATDLLAEADRLRDTCLLTRESHQHIAQQRDETRAQLVAIRAALGNGADEAAWRPGETLAEAVGRLRGEQAAVVTWLRLGAWHDVFDMSSDSCLDDLANAIERGDHLHVLPSGPHAEALGAGNDEEDDGA